MRSIIFFSLTIILLITFLYLVRPFLYSIFWAAIIAVLFQPIHKFVNKYIDIPSISSLICVILVIVMIFLPLFLLSVVLIQQSVDLYISFAENNTIISNVQGIANWLQKTSVAPYIQSLSDQWTQYAVTAAKTVSIFLFENIKNLTQNSVKFIIMLLIMLYTLFYFFKDGKKIANYLLYISPIGNKYEAMFYEKFRNTAVSTLKTTLIIGGLQGGMGGLLFWATGIKGAFIWGVIMVALSLIPALGSFIIWFPAAIIMLATGNIWQGVLILIIGTFLISTIDNLLRPILVSKGTEMHPLIVLFTTLGGIIFFGISGFIIGPIVAALFLAVMSIYSHYYRNELNNN
ncbi:MAG: AI-2E family transporter [bacterium]|nr:AI-2E family transporter [bacterium]